MTDAENLKLHLDDALNLTPRVLDHVRRLGLILYHLELNQTSPSTSTLRLRVNGGARQLRLLKCRLSQVPGVERQLPDTPTLSTQASSVGDISTTIACSITTSMSQSG